MKENIFFITILLFIFILSIYICNKTNFTKSKKKEEIKVILEGLYTIFKNNFVFYDKGKNLENVEHIYSVVMPDRKEYMIKKLNQLNVNYTLFDAITPKNITQKNYDTLSTTNDPKSKLFNHPSRLPLQLSFTMCFLDAIKKGYSTIIVFEDDIIVKVDNTTLINSISTFKKSEYAFFYMGYCWMDCNQKFTLHELVEVPDKTLFCCHAICYKVKYLPNLIESMYPMNNNLDDNVVNFIKKYNLKVCVPTSTFFDQNRKELKTQNDDDNIGNLPECNSIFNSHLKYNNTIL